MAEVKKINDVEKIKNVKNSENFLSKKDFISLPKNESSKMIDNLDINDSNINSNITSLENKENIDNTNIMAYTTVKKNNEKKFNIKTNSVLQEKLKKIFLGREKRKFEYNKQEIPENLKYHSDSTNSEQEQKEKNKEENISNNNKKISVIKKQKSGIAINNNKEKEKENKSLNLQNDINNNKKLKEKKTKSFNQKIIDNYLNDINKKEVKEKNEKKSSALKDIIEKLKAKKIEKDELYKKEKEQKELKQEKEKEKPKLKNIIPNRDKKKHSKKNNNISNKSINTKNESLLLPHKTYRDENDDEINSFNFTTKPKRNNSSTKQESKEKSKNQNEQIYNRRKQNSSSVKMGHYYDYIPIVRRENILNLNSRIIFTNKEVQLLTKRISLGNKNKKVSLNLLYRASIDGDTEPILKLNTHNKLKTLTLFYTYEGARFGVYTEKEGVKSIFQGYELYEVPGTSFIISLNNLIYYNVKPKETSLYDKSDNILCFGFCSRINNNETNWLIYTSRNYFIGKKYLFGDKNDVYLNLDYKKIVGNNPSYHIKDVEIFDVMVETLK